MMSTASRGGDPSWRAGWSARLRGLVPGSRAEDGVRGGPGDAQEAAFTLVDAGRPVPPGAVVMPVRSGGVSIRAAFWMPPQAERPPGTVLICTGRTEFIEKYFPVVAELQARGFAVATFDWRGQGLSGRPLRDRHKGHVGHFADYEGDLLAVVAQVVDRFCPRPLFGLAHSMGGTIALNVAADHPELFRRLVLSAPMVEIARALSPQTIRAIAWVCRNGGLARSTFPGDHGPALISGIFEGNFLTSDEARYRAAFDYLLAEPRLGLGGPTIGWLHAAFTAMARLHAADYPERMRTPVLAVVPGADRLVESRATERLVGRLRASRAVTVPECRHEILLERDVFRRAFWAAFDAFVPGTA